MAGKTNFQLLIKILQQLADAEFPSKHFPQPGIQLLILISSKETVKQESQAVLCIFVTD